ncbi:hypothetical protein Q9Q94_16355 [Uliginosibacterium sp. 31-16]|uniref:hypothetical protein n=1 Tax=Uliginosibacterium sp. 31-16 TaxID=3068315 RepID=UPI00273D5B0A|nr:hypothetical protein [Uliginosibacterium sp. 31-16]MDP5241115.1 hypothetical protein [Uliginosibacterium sp. 31-16]
MKRRQLTLGIALLVTLLIVWWVSGLDEEDSARPTSKRPRGQNARTATSLGQSKISKPASRTSNVSQSYLLAQLALAHTPRNALPAIENNPFASASFEPPPPQVEPSKPTAPPLRFKYLGKVAEGTHSAVFLDDGDSMLIAREGDTLVSQYRVIAIGEHSLQLEYLPLNTPQTLNY